MNTRRGVAVLKVLYGVLAVAASVTVFEVSAKTQATINSIGLLVLGAILAFVAQSIRDKKAKRVKNEDRHTDDVNIMRNKITELERKLAVVDQTILPLNAAYQQMLVKQLTHYHTPRGDVLLAKLGPPFTLTRDEEKELLEIMAEREVTLNGEIDDSERDAAHMLPLVMKRVRAELEAPGAPVVLKIVEVGVDPTSTGGKGPKAGEPAAKTDDGT